MPILSPSSVHVDQALTDVSIAFLQRGTYLHNRMFPPIPVPFQTGKYFTLPRGYFNRISMRERAPGETAARGTYAQETQTFNCKVFALAHDVADEVRGNADVAINIDLQATEFLTTQAALFREKAWATRYFQPGVWSTTIAGVASGAGSGAAGAPGAGQTLRWDDANSDPIKVIKAQCTNVEQSTGLRPNKMAISRAVLDALTEHPDIIDRIKYGQTPGSPAIANLEILAQIFGLQEVVVGSAVENAAAEGLADNHQFILSKSVLLAHAAPSPGIMTASAGYTFVWQDATVGVKQGLGIKRARNPDPTANADIFWIEDSFEQKVVSPDLAVFLHNVIG